MYSAQREHLKEESAKIVESKMEIEKNKIVTLSTEIEAAPKRQFFNVNQLWEIKLNLSKMNFFVLLSIKKKKSSGRVS